jgi:hypothetical protein
MLQAFSHIFNFFNIASPCGDMIIENFLKKCHDQWQNLWILNSKTAPNLQNLFAYSRVKSVSDGCFLY